MMTISLRWNYRSNGIQKFLYNSNWKKKFGVRSFVPSSMNHRCSGTESKSIFSYIVQPSKIRRLLIIF